MRVNCSLCSIWNRANVFYQVFTSKKHTPPVVCTQCCAWEGCSQCLLQLGTQREQIPVAARVGAQQEPGASAWHFQKLCFVTAETKHSSHLPVSPAANSAATQERIFTSQSPFSLQIHSLITLYPVQNGRLKDATQNLPVLGQPYKHNSYKSYTSRMSFQENSKCCQ